MNALDLHLHDYKGVPILAILQPTLCSIQIKKKNMRRHDSKDT
jgi:hypothetical protein